MKSSKETLITKYNTVKKPERLAVVLLNHHTTGNGTVCCILHLQWLAESNYSRTSQQDVAMSRRKERLCLILPKMTLICCVR